MSLPAPSRGGGSAEGGDGGGFSPPPGLRGRSLATRGGGGLPTTFHPRVPCFEPASGGTKQERTPPNNLLCPPGQSRAPANEHSRRKPHHLRTTIRRQSQRQRAPLAPPRDPPLADEGGGSAKGGDGGVFSPPPGLRGRSLATRGGGGLPTTFHPRVPCFDPRSGQSRNGHHPTTVSALRVNASQHPRHQPRPPPSRSARHLPRQDGGGNKSSRANEHPRRRLFPEWPVPSG